MQRIYRYLSTTTPPPPPPRRARRHALGRVQPRPVAHTLASTTTELDSFNAPLYTLKAFAIATSIVVSTATASVAGVMAYLNVHDTAAFAAHMRTWLSQSMPLLTAKIYRRPTSSDTVPDDPVLLAASSPSDSTRVDPDAVQHRLSEAFDKGGLEAWAEAVAREMEAETETERVRKGKRT